MWKKKSIKHYENLISFRRLPAITSVHKLKRFMILFFLSFCISYGLQWAAVKIHWSPIKHPSQLCFPILFLIETWYGNSPCVAFLLSIGFAFPKFWPLAFTFSIIFHNIFHIFGRRIITYGLFQKSLSILFTWYNWKFWKNALINMRSYVSF